MKTLKPCAIILAVILLAAGTAYSSSSELRYAVSALKVAAGYNAADADADTDGNGTVGINDVICSLQIAAGFRLGSPDITLIAPTATDRLTVAWLPVSDDFTSEDNISYGIHLSKQERFQPSADTLVDNLTFSLKTSLYICKDFV